ncbi:hypothetical protein [Nostoc sp. DedSLP04]|nr:hypothetical protein [Nostoc sp. DedSLP04]MDZ8033839.1 hypothetical protein [Nostoc sp. DedSLP04]
MQPQLVVRVGVARTSLRDGARSLLPRSGTTKLSDHRKHRMNRRMQKT